MQSIDVFDGQKAEGYPDSDKIGVWSGNEPDELIFKRGTAVEWSEGEEGWNLAS